MNRSYTVSLLFTLIVLSSVFGVLNLDEKHVLYSLSIMSLFATGLLFCFGLFVFLSIEYEKRWGILKKLEPFYKIGQVVYIHGCIPAEINGFKSSKEHRFIYSFNDKENGDFYAKESDISLTFKGLL